jgi:hypothetical protein
VLGVARLWCRLPVQARSNRVIKFWMPVCSWNISNLCDMRLNPQTVYQSYIQMLKWQGMDMCTVLIANISIARKSWTMIVSFPKSISVFLLIFHLSLMCWAEQCSCHHGWPCSNLQTICHFFICATLIMPEKIKKSNLYLLQEYETFHPVMFQDCDKQVTYLIDCCW